MMFDPQESYHLWRAALSEGSLAEEPLVGELLCNGALSSAWGDLSSRAERAALERDVELNLLLPSAVSSPYQAPLATWILECWRAPSPESPQRRVIFPLSDLEGRERWVCLTVYLASASSIQVVSESDLASDHADLEYSSPLPCTLSEVSAGVYAERLSARGATLLSFQHDIANQLFLFKALPELAGFSSPSDLVSDVLEGAPLLLSFLEQRLSRDWTDSQLIEEVRGADAISEALSSWMKRDSVSARWTLSTEGLDDAVGLVTLGIQWSITQLASRIRHRHLSGVNQSAQVQVSVAPASPSELPIVGICGQLTRADSRLEVSIEVEGWDVAQLAQDWSRAAHWRGRYAAAQRRDASPAELGASWFGSWVSAAQLTRGVVQINGSKLCIIC